MKERRSFISLPVMKLNTVQKYDILNDKFLFYFTLFWFVCLVFIINLRVIIFLKEMTLLILLIHSQLFRVLLPTLTLFSIHGRASLSIRRKNISNFSKSTNGVLFATDVAARGLDLPEVEWVFQYVALFRETISSLSFYLTFFFFLIIYSFLYCSFHCVYEKVHLF